MSDIKTTLHIKTGEALPRPDSSGSNYYSLVEFNLNTARALIPESNLMAVLDSNSRQAATKNGIVVFDNYDDFMGIVKPSMERYGLTVQDPVENVKRFDYIEDIFERPEYRKIDGYRERKENLIPLRGPESVSVTINVKAGYPNDQSQTVYVLESDNQYKVMQSIGERGFAYHNSAGKLMIALNSTEFKTVKENLTSNGWEVSALMKKYHGDKQQLFYGVDKKPMGDMIVPRSDDDIQVVTNLVTEEQKLIKTQLQKGQVNEFGETACCRTASILRNGEAKVVPYSALNVTHRRATEREAEQFMRTTDYLNHPFLSSDNSSKNNLDQTKENIRSDEASSVYENDFSPS